MRPKCPSVLHQKGDLFRPTRPYNAELCAYVRDVGAAAFSEQSVSSHGMMDCAAVD